MKLLLVLAPLLPIHAQTKDTEPSAPPAGKTVCWRMPIDGYRCKDSTGKTWRQFMDGEVLKLDGVEVTILDPRSHSGPCLEFGRNNRILQNGAAACADPGLGFFKVHLTDANSDYIEIIVGTETVVPGLNQPIVLFTTYTSPVQTGIDTSVGEIRDLDKIRTIRVRLLKVRTEQVFK